MSGTGADALRGRRVLLGITGGIAAYKVAQVARSLAAAGAGVHTIMTEAAMRFVGPDTFAALTGNPVHTSVFEEPGVVLHVELAREADLAVVAPATANVLAKLAHGRADDLLTSTLLEARCPLLVAPAMHTGMWEHPATQHNVATLRVRGVAFVGPVEGSLAAGDEGMGRMAEPEDIVAALVSIAAHARDFAERKIVVSAGPTHEPIDPVRFIGNRSSGRMGAEIAAEAASRGADVTLVLGPGVIEPPPGVNTIRVETAREMRDAMVAASDDADAVVMAAAVADFRPAEVSPSKIKRASGAPDIHLEPTPDVLREVRKRSKAVLVGFAAETGDLEREGRRKLEDKDIDLIVVNEVGREGTGFGSETNDALLLSRTGDDEPLRTWTKRELAATICDRIAALLK